MYEFCKLPLLGLDIFPKGIYNRYISLNVIEKAKKMTERVETEIKNCVVEAQRHFYAGRCGVTGGIMSTATATLPCSDGDIVIKLVAHSPYQKSFAKVAHPALGDWMCYLNGGSTQNGEFGRNPGKPIRL